MHQTELPDPVKTKTRLKRAVGPRKMAVQAIAMADAYVSLVRVLAIAIPVVLEFLFVTVLTSS